MGAWSGWRVRDEPVYTASSVGRHGPSAGFSAAEAAVTIAFAPHFR
ncbi:hypothetical protein [Acetobacter orleanensis]|nr:hypothetical protein [Acetobacter orleanensis]